MLTLLGSLLALFLISLSHSAAAQMTDEVANEWARKHHCFKCHAIDKHKQAPPYRHVAEKFADDPEAVEKIIAHLQSGRQVKLTSGIEVEHRVVVGESPETLRSIAQWILGLREATAK